MHHVMPQVDPHPVIVTLRDNKDCTRVLFYCYHSTIAGWEVLLGYAADDVNSYSGWDSTPTNMRRKSWLDRV